MSNLHAVGRPCEFAMTLDEIARELGVSSERVRQIETSALAKAKAILESHGYTLQDMLPDVNLG